MFRSLIGFAIFAVVALIAIKFVFGLIGFAIGLFGSLLWLAFLGFVIYMVVRLISPGTADRIRDTIKGRPAV
jgi:cytosine/uracil/thiamine/allantoin permease